MSLVSSSKRSASFAAPAVLALLLVSSAAAQIIPGDLLVSRSTYDGVASTVNVGQALPGGGVAVADGSSLNVFNNETPDPSFGVTSSILIDQVNTSSNTVDNTIDVTQLAANNGVNLSTSFPSKSELALNVATDGSAVTFMGYVAPTNVLDVSNANTPNHMDSTNPVSSTYQRGIAQLNLDGSLTVTPTNAYSGNNGRAAILVSGTGGSPGNYFTVGNAGNSGKAATLTNSTVTASSTTVTLSSTKAIVAGEAVTGTGIPGGTTIQSVVDATHVTLSAAATTSATESLTIGTSPSATMLSQLSDNTGVQTIAVGSSGDTQVVGQVNGTFGNATGYQRGFSITQTGAAADKTGKDDNFRGETVFNNTLYVTKGSGSNGVNTVFQVGATGSVKSLAANAGTTPFSILPGFNTTAASTATSGPNPFGLFFANASTLYVADEGDGTAADAATSTFAGLQKWVNSKADGTGTWSKVYTLTSGLGLGASYTVSGKLLNGTTGSITTMTDGLRNITGMVSGNTVKLFAVTSTAGSSITDSGADPNQLVEITDLLDSTTGTGETFTTLETAAYGDVLRGVTLAPIPEPSTYAVLAGALVLGYTMTKRRRLLGSV